jgi:hypothetical protein
MKEEALLTLPRQKCFELGYITVKDLDDEELRHGRCRGEDGRIPNKNGRKTELIPRDLYDEMVAEHELRYKQKLRQRLDDMLDIMDDIARDDTVEPRDRFEAAKYLFERTAGKTPDNVLVNVRHAPWEELLAQVAGIAPMSRAEHMALDRVGIVDAEIVEEDAFAEGTQEGTPEAGDSRDAEQGYQTTTGKPKQTTKAEANAADMNYWVEGDVTKRGQNVQPPAEPHQDQPEKNYGRRADENRSYAQQVQDAQDLAKRRKEAKAKIQNAKKWRKVDRALGADAIKDEITGVTLGEDGKMEFDVE